MVPAPITTAFFTGRGWVSAGMSGTRCASRSPKKMCRSATLCSPSTSRMNCCRSTSSPSSKEWVSAARTAATQPLGLSWPRARLSKTVAAASKAAMSAPAIMSRRLRARMKVLPDFAAARAHSMAPCSSSPSMTASMKPSFTASSARIGSPVTMIFSAASPPISRGRRCVPPAPGTKPRLTSGSPTWAPAIATRAWQASANSSPPPSALPWMAATIGILLFSIASNTSGRLGGWRGLLNSVISAPAENIRPAPISTMARAPSRAERCSPASSPARTPVRSVLTGGLAMRSTCTSPSKACSTNCASLCMVVLPSARSLCRPAGATCCCHVTAARPACQSAEAINAACSTPRGQRSLGLGEAA